MYPFNLVYIAALLCGYLASSVTTADELTKFTHAKPLAPIVERGILRVAMYEQDSPPFYYAYPDTLAEFRREACNPEGKAVPVKSLNDGTPFDCELYYSIDNSILHTESAQVGGLDVELIKGFAQKLGVKVSFLRTADSLDDVVSMVAKGEADLGISKLSITFNRTTKVLFTKPYIKLRKALIVNRTLLEQIRCDRTKEQAIQHLKGNVGVIRDSSYVTYARQRFIQDNPTATAKSWCNTKAVTVVEFDSWEEVIKRLKAGTKTYNNQPQSIWQWTHKLFPGASAPITNKKHNTESSASCTGLKPEERCNPSERLALIAGFRDEAEIKYLIKNDKKLTQDFLTVVLENDFDAKGIALPADAYFLKFMLEVYFDSLGVKLTANNVILNYADVIQNITRFRRSGSSVNTHSTSGERQ